MERVYVLIKVDAGSIEPVVEAISALEGQKVVDAVTGTYDILVTLEGDSIARLLSSAVREIRNVPGVASTETLVAVRL